MSKLFGAAVAITMFFSIDALVLTKNAEAGVTCRTDYFGNYVCRDPMEIALQLEEITLVMM